VLPKVASPITQELTMNPRLTTGLSLCTAAVALLSFSLMAQAQTRTPGCALVEVQNLRPGQGALMVAAYGDAATFQKTPSTAIQLEAKAETMQVQVCGLGEGAVALTLFQDLNNNGKLDRNPFGIPNEPWGASGKTSAFSAPTWESAQVPLDGSTIVIKMTQ
jgi:uncharacterized protein (DUF2141 family)